VLSLTLPDHLNDINYKYTAANLLQVYLFRRFRKAMIATNKTNKVSALIIANIKPRFGFWYNLICVV